jgi:hypothetical protein
MGRERRKFKRVNVHLPATVRVADGAEHSAEILNLSEGGALVSCSAPFAAVGQTLLLIVHLTTSNLELTAKVSDRGLVELDLSEDEPEESVIRWVSGGAGGNFGVQFVDMRPEKQLNLGQVVQALGEKFGWDE